MVLAMPGIDGFVVRNVFRLLRPVFAFGVAPRTLARVLLTAAALAEIIAVIIEANGPVFDLVIGGLWSIIVVNLLYFTVPRWDRHNERVNEGILTLSMALDLRSMSNFRIMVFGGSVASLGSSVLFAVLLGGWPGLLNVVWGVSASAVLLSLVCCTTMGRPPRSIVKRAVDRVKQAIADRPRLPVFGLQT